MEVLKNFLLDLTKTKGLLTHTVIGGEFAVGSDIEQIAFKTLLGSCVAIMFYDKDTKSKVWTIFITKTNNTNDDMKYGFYSVEVMLNEMYKLGCKSKIWLQRFQVVLILCN